MATIIAVVTADIADIAIAVLDINFEALMAPAAAELVITVVVVVDVDVVE